MVIGLGRFGTSVATTLFNLGHDVLAVDISENAVKLIVHDVTHAVQADARDERKLTALGIRNYDVAVVGIGNDVEASVLITVMLKEMGIPYVVAKAANTIHGKVLARVGADKVSYPEKDMGNRLAHYLVTGYLMDYIELSPDYSVIELVTPSKFVGKTIGELKLRSRFAISVIAIKDGDDITISPGADAMIRENDILVFIGKTDVFNKLLDKK